MIYIQDVQNRSVSYRNSVITFKNDTNTHRNNEHKAIGKNNEQQ